MLAAIVLSACAAAAQVPAAQPIDIDDHSPHQATAAATSERDSTSVRIVRANSTHHDWRPRGEHRNSGAALNNADEGTPHFTRCVLQLDAPKPDALRSDGLLIHHLDLPPPAMR